MVLKFVSRQLTCVDLSFGHSRPLFFILVFSNSCLKCLGKLLRDLNSRLFNTVASEQMFNINLPMAGFELQNSVVRSDRSTNCATTTVLSFHCLRLPPARHPGHKRCNVICLFDDEASRRHHQSYLVTIYPNCFVSSSLLMSSTPIYYLPTTMLLTFTKANLPIQNALQRRKENCLAALMGRLYSTCQLTWGVGVEGDD